MCHLLPHHAAPLSVTLRSHTQPQNTRDHLQTLIQKPLLFLKSRHHFCFYNLSLLYGGWSQVLLGLLGGRAHTSCPCVCTAVSQRGVSAPSWPWEGGAVEGMSSQRSSGLPHTLCLAGPLSWEVSAMDTELPTSGGWITAPNNPLDQWLTEVWGCCQEVSVGSLPKEFKPVTQAPCPQRHLTLRSHPHAYSTRHIAPSSHSATWKLPFL